MVDIPPGTRLIGFQEGRDERMTFDPVTWLERERMPAPPYYVVDVNDPERRPRIPHPTIQQYHLDRERERDDVESEEDAIPRENSPASTVRLKRRKSTSSSSRSTEKEKARCRTGVISPLSRSPLRPLSPLPRIALVSRHECPPPAFWVNERSWIPPRPCTPERCFCICNGCFCTNREPYALYYPLWLRRQLDRAFELQREAVLFGELDPGAEFEALEEEEPAAAERPWVEGIVERDLVPFDFGEEAIRPPSRRRRPHVFLTRRIERRRSDSPVPRIQRGFSYPRSPRARRRFSY